MKNVKLTIEYEGTNYSGWQNQENAITIQQVIEKAIYDTSKEHTRLIGSGRTDKGVHALGLVANFFTNCTIPGEKFKFVLNNVLPVDITIIESEEVSLDFHARYSALKKRYVYKIYNDKKYRPLFRNYSYHYKHDLDIEKMKEASKYLLGTHDFCSFMGRKTNVYTTIRTIYSIDIEKDDNFIIMTFEGDSFLKNMVRIIVGTLINAGNKKMQVEEMQEILDGKDRRLAGRTAPPQGLYLEKVFYD
ncbi:MAG: tRNA pseudouridine(38-40) synthase TruA [Tissierellia bacterium]|nr:tRNA pseudouridine(38-40) synthase TruA [Tissierellia bacterium]MDD4726473.1 tRNA pseudouridine(38-40) synthase TruA [Tissierellia bacterium]